jgi:hypothetical protein
MVTFASVMIGSEFFHTMDDLATIGVWVHHGGGLLAACREGFCFKAVCYVWSWIDGRSETSQLPLEGWQVHFDLISKDSRSSNRKGPPWVEHLNTWEALGIWNIPELIGSLTSGGNQGDLSERSARPKSPRDLRASNTARSGSGWVTGTQYLEVKMKDEQEQSRMDQGTNPRLKGNAKQKEVQEWTLDLY